MGQVIAFRPRNPTAIPAPVKHGDLTTYEFHTRAMRDLFVLKTPGSWAGYSVTPDGYRWFAYIVE
jgi:hypothetical protein